MNVGSLLEVYTTMFGWSIYDTMFTLFRETGLILFPFILMIYRNWKEPLISQNDKASSLVSQARVQFDTLSMMFVFMVAVVPFAGVDLSTVSYRVACTDSGGATSVTTDVSGGSTGTTYDARLGSISGVKMPIVWWLTLNLGSGVNSYVSSSFTCFEDIKGLDQQLRNLTIKDQDLRSEYFRFANECFLPSKSKYAEAMRGGNYHDYVVDVAIPAYFTTPGILTGPDDFFYIGSRFYLQTDGFYKEFDVTTCNAASGGCGFQAKYGVKGWAVNQVRDRYPEDMIATPDPQNPLYGKPYCDEWWLDASKGLKKKLLESLEASKVYVEKDPSDTWYYETIIKGIKNTYTTLAYPEEQLSDLVIKRYVNEDPPGFTANNGGFLGGMSGNDFANVHLSTGIQDLEKFGGYVAAAGVSALALRTGGKFGAVASGASSSSQSFAAQMSDFYTNMFIVKQAAPMVQAILLMMVYILLLVYLVMSDYDIDAVLQMVFIILGFQFFTTLWNLADYLDAQLFVSMYPEETWLGGFATYGPNRLILDAVLTLLYVVVPFLLLWIMSVAGVKAGQLSGSLGPLARPASTKGSGSGVNKAANDMKK